jgi:oligosaccharide repeat unit polymerase
MISFIFPFKYYVLVVPRLEESLLFYLGILSVFSGMMIPFMFSSKSWKNTNIMVIYNHPRFRRINITLLTLSSVLIALKLRTIIQVFGNDWFLKFGPIRIAYLKGELSYPLVIRFFEILFIPMFYCNVFLYTFSESPVRSKRSLLFYSILWFLLIAFSDISIGARSQIAFAFFIILIVYLLRQALRNDDSNARASYFSMSALVVFISALFIFIGSQREGVPLRVGLEQFLIYIVGPSYATMMLFKNQLSNYLGRTFGYYTFGGILRIFFGDSSIPLDFGYTPIYSNMKIGFNSYTLLSYFWQDFGVFSILLLFLLGFSVSKVYIKLMRNPSIKNFVFASAMLFIISLSFRDLITKWVSFWGLLLFSLMIFKAIKAKMFKANFSTTKNMKEQE